MQVEEINAISGEVVDAAMRVHTALGPRVIGVSLRKVLAARATAPRIEGANASWFSHRLWRREDRVGTENRLAGNGPSDCGIEIRRNTAFRS
jgi:hypothetical protein